MLDVGGSITIYLVPFAEPYVDDGLRDWSGSFNVTAVSEKGAC